MLFSLNLMHGDSINEDEDDEALAYMLHTALSIAQRYPPLRPTSATCLYMCVDTCIDISTSMLYKHLYVICKH